MALLVDDGIFEEYTVVGFWFESMERWANTYMADTALHAEDMAQREAAEKGLHLGVTGVFKGRLMNVDGYATWVDATAKSQAEMDMVMSELGLWKVGENRRTLGQPETKRKWFK